MYYKTVVPKHLKIEYFVNWYSFIYVRRFHNDELENVPFFMFGDFNFRLDTEAVMKVKFVRSLGAFQLITHIILDTCG